MTRQEKVRKAHDGRQQVIEVVGDATGELPDGVHLLGLSKTKLQIFLLGDVEQIDNRGRFAGTVVIEPARNHLRDPFLAIPEGHIHHTRRGLNVERDRQPFRRRRAVLVIEQLAEIAPGDVSRGNACNLREGPVRLDDKAGFLDQRNPNRRIGKQAGEARLGRRG